MSKQLLDAIAYAVSLADDQRFQCHSQCHSKEGEGGKVRVEGVVEEWKGMPSIELLPSSMTFKDGKLVPQLSDSGPVHVQGNNTINAISL